MRLVVVDFALLRRVAAAVAAGARARLLAYVVHWRDRPDLGRPAPSAPLVLQGGGSEYQRWYDTFGITLFKVLLILRFGPYIVVLTRIALQSG